MYFQVTGPSERQNEAYPRWMPRRLAPADPASPADRPEPPATETRSVPGRGSRLWEDNFRELFELLTRVASRYPGLQAEVNALLIERDRPEIWQ